MIVQQYIILFTNLFISKVIQLIKTCLKSLLILLTHRDLVLRKYINILKKIFKKIFFHLIFAVQSLKKINTKIIFSHKSYLTIFIKFSAIVDHVKKCIVNINTFFLWKFIFQQTCIQYNNMVDILTQAQILIR